MKLIIFIGNVGCGKSTKALELAKKGFAIVNDDAITIMFGAGDYTLYDKRKKPIYKNIISLAVMMSLNYNFDVVIDMPNMSKEKRKKFIDMGKFNKAEIIAYDWGPGMLKDLIARLKDDRGYNNWEAAYRKKFEEYEEPSLDEGFVEIIKMR